MLYKQTNDLSTPKTKHYSFDKQRNGLFIAMSRIIRLAFLFIYATFPMWSSWVASHLGYREVSSTDMIIAMAWMPISGAIIALSFMKFGWKHKLKGTLLFIIYNAIALSGLLFWVKHI